MQVVPFRNALGPESVHYYAAVSHNCFKDSVKPREINPDLTRRPFQQLREG